MMNRIVICVLIAGVGLAAPQARKQTEKPQPKPVLMDINSAWQTDLEKLPGITRPLAKKIISNRPYDKVDDLARAGVPKATIERLRPLVIAGDSMPASHPRRGAIPSTGHAPKKK